MVEIKNTTKSTAQIECVKTRYFLNWSSPSSSSQALVVIFVSGFQTLVVIVVVFVSGFQTLVVVVVSGPCRPRLRLRPSSSSSSQILIVLVLVFFGRYT
ncbi:uncharacterized protein A4U43_C09F9240, partial [Asparagus officinalis]